MVKLYQREGWLALQPSGADGTAPDEYATRSPEVRLDAHLRQASPPWGRQRCGICDAAMHHRWPVRQDTRGREVPATPPDQIVGEVVPPSEDQSVAELRARSARARRLAEIFQHDQSAPRLRALADDLQARADALPKAPQQLQLMSDAVTA